MASKRVQAAAKAGERLWSSGNASAHAAGAVRTAELKPRPPSAAGRVATFCACATSALATPPKQLKWVGSRRGAHREEKPRALQIRELRELVQQFPLGPHPLCRPRCHEVRVAHGGAQHNQPSLFQWFVPAPRVRPQLSDTGGRRTAGAAVHSCLALVGGYMPHSVSTMPTITVSWAARARSRIQIVEERKQAVRRMKGGGGFEQGSMLSQCKKGRGQRITLLTAFALGDVVIGPDKTAVLVVGCRTRNFNFTLNDVPVPVVPEYCYLGVVFQSSRKWSKHGERLYTNSNRKFHQFLTSAENRQLHTGFRRSLFQSYVLPSMLYGCQFLSNSTVTFLDKKLRQWGRRLLQWPSGAPGATVLGELGWAPFRHEVLRSQFSLFGRLCSADPAGAHRRLAARVFRYALCQQHSWAQEVSNHMRDCGIHAPHVRGVSPGCNRSTVAAWRRRRMCPALDRHAAAARRAEVAAVPSLRLFAECHPRLSFCPKVVQMFIAHVCPLL